MDIEEQMYFKNKIYTLSKVLKILSKKTSLEDYKDLQEGIITNKIRTSIIIH